MTSDQVFEVEKQALTFRGGSTKSAWGRRGSESPPRSWKGPCSPATTPPAPTAASNYPRACWELQIEDERIRRQVIAPLQEARRILDTAPARTAHHDDVVSRQVAEPKPPIALFLLQLHENKIRTPSPRVHPVVARRSGVTYPLPVAPLLAETGATLTKSETSSATNFRDLAAQNPSPSFPKFAACAPRAAGRQSIPSLAPQRLGCILPVHSALAATPAPKAGEHVYQDVAK